MKSKFVVNFSLIFIFLLTNSLNAQEITSGLEALTVTELPNGGKTYSLSLKILALQTPPNQILIAISLFLTFFIMAPTFNKIYSDVSGPYQNGEITMT